MAGQPDADRRWLTAALVLITGFMIAEVVVGVLAQSLALVTDAAHMLTDAASIVLALIAIWFAARPARGRYTYGFSRVEILSAQANGITLLLLAAWFVYEGIERLINPPEVQGLLVFVTGLVGIVVNLAATWCISQANRSSLNVEGAFQHILNDLFAFIATTAAGAVVWLTGFARADALAALVVAALMVKAGWGLIRESGRVFLEAAPPGTDPDAIGAELAALPGVAEVHDLHLWEISSGQAALSAHVLVDHRADCHPVGERARALLRANHHLEHITLQVDHKSEPLPAVEGESPHPAPEDACCIEPHGAVHVGSGLADNAKPASSSAVVSDQDVSR